MTVQNIPHPSSGPPQGGSAGKPSPMPEAPGQQRPPVKAKRTRRTRRVTVATFTGVFMTTILVGSVAAALGLALVVGLQAPQTSMPADFAPGGDAANLYQVYTAIPTAVPPPYLLLPVNGGTVE